MFYYCQQEADVVMTLNENFCVYFPGNGWSWIKQLHHAVSLRQNGFLVLLNHTETEKDNN